jgi:hypothetical protein
VRQTALLFLAQGIELGDDFLQASMRTLQLGGTRAPFKRHARAAAQGRVAPFSLAGAADHGLRMFVSFVHAAFCSVICLGGAYCSVGCCMEIPGMQGAFSIVLSWQVAH